MRRKVKRMLMIVLLSSSITMCSIKVVILPREEPGFQLDDPGGGSGTGGLDFHALRSMIE